MHRTTIAVLALSLLGSAADAARSPGEQVFISGIGRECTVIRIWPDGSEHNIGQPGSVERVVGTSTVTSIKNPSIIVAPPPAAIAKTGVAVVYCPGSKGNKLSVYAGVRFAHWVNAMGATAVLLKYKPSHTRPGALPDAQRAVSVLRSRAGDLGIDPAKIIVAGSGTGGSLALRLSVDHKVRAYSPVDERDRKPCRPDAVILFSPASPSSDDPPTARSPLQTDDLKQRNVPPVFVTTRQGFQALAQCLQTVSILRKVKLAVELHVYPATVDGPDLREYPAIEYARSCARFLVDHGLFTEQMRVRGNAWLDGQVDAAKAAMPVPRAGPRRTFRDLPPLNPVTDLTEGEAAIQKAAGTKLPVYRLWPDRKPSQPESVTYRGNIMRITKVTAPSITIFRAPKPDGRAVVVCPGGGYSILAAEHEGVDVCEWLNGLGITTFLLKYTVPRPKGAAKHSKAILDARQAIKMVRSGAKGFGIDPNKVGILGFSAGGHLTALTCYSKDDASRPNFGMPIYPAYLVVDKKGTIDPLLAKPDKTKMPPLFIPIAADDRFRSGAGHWFHLLTKSGVNAEFHVYEKGGHGKGLRPDGYPFSEWTKACERWLGGLEARGSD